MTILFLAFYALSVGEGNVTEAFVVLRQALLQRELDFVLVLTSLILAPLLENLLLLGLGFGIRKSRRAQALQKPLLLGGGFLVGLLVHGVALANLGRAIAFGILALLFDERRNASLKGAYGDSVLAHSLWNAISLLLLLWAQS